MAKLQNHVTKDVRGSVLDSRLDASSDHRTPPAVKLSTEPRGTYYKVRRIIGPNYPRTCAHRHPHPCTRTADVRRESCAPRSASAHTKPGCSISQRSENLLGPRLCLAYTITWLRSSRLGRRQGLRKAVLFIRRNAVYTALHNRRVCYDVATAWPWAGRERRKDGQTSVRSPNTRGRRALSRPEGSKVV